MYKKFLNIYKNMGLPAKAALWFVFCNLMQKGISVITVPIFTRLLSTAEYGTYSLYLSWFNILTIVTSLQLYYGVYNNALNKMQESGARDRYISSMQGLTISLTFILMLVYLPFQNFWSDLLGLDRNILWMMIGVLFVEPALYFWQGRQRFEYRYKIMVGVTLLQSVLNPALGLVLVLATTGDRATARIASVVIVEFVVAGTIMVFQFVKGKTFVDLKYWKYALAFNVPLLPHYLSGMILTQGDRIMIQHMVNKSAVGVYSLAYSIGMLVMLFTNAINNSMTPWAYENLNKKDFRNIRENTTYIIALLAGLIIIVLFFVPELVCIFGSAEYYDAIYVVPPVACSVFFIFLFNVFAIPQMYYEKQKFMAVASICAAILNVGLNAICIPIFGYVAAGYTTLASYIVYSVGHFLFSRKVCMEMHDTFELFDGKAIVGVSSVVIVCSVLFNFIYQWTWIRYSILVLILATVFWKRKRILNVLSTLKERK